LASLITREIEISIAEPFQRALTEQWLALVVEHALQMALDPGESGQVSLVITDDATIQELNRKYRGLDEVTDVLSFSSVHSGHWEGEGEVLSDNHFSSEDSASSVFIFPPDVAPPLGEVIISYPQACRQAEARNESKDRELALLIVHGVLHLVGHDHLDPADAALMQARERAALEKIFPARTDSL
jgi:probable rRNA maturation factor